jgi:hypothetical protein
MQARLCGNISLRARFTCPYDEQLPFLNSMCAMSERSRQTSQTPHISGLVQARYASEKVSQMQLQDKLSSP